MEHPPIRILGIAPYEDMRTDMEKIGADYPQIHLDVYTGDMEEGVLIVKRSAPESYDAIISRGGTAKLIRQVTSIPVVSIQLSVYDVLRAIRMAESYSKVYAVVGFPDITEPAHILCDLLRYNTDIITVHSAEEAAASLSQLKAAGCSMVVCDVITHTIAQRKGFDAFLINSGAESLHAAFDEALAVSLRFQALRQENLFLQRIAKEKEGNTIILDRSGELFYSVQESPSPTWVSAMRKRIPEIPPASQLKFYESEGRQLYSVTAGTLRVGGERYYMFRYHPSRIPLRSSRSGIQAFSEGEISQFIMGSFFSISGAMGELEGKLDAIASSGQPILIAGEVGTGKEQIARLLYLHSPRTKSPFVSIDCTLMDDKGWDYLFNHYNSPLNDQGSTVYFQYFEVLPEQRRAELLASLMATDMAKRIQLIFSCDCVDGEPLPEAAHIITARLGCFTLHLPTLRSRSDEIPSLAGFYLNSLNLDLGKQIIGFDPKAIELLRNYNWPNNYTQFKQVLSELAILTDSSYIRGSTVSDLLSRKQTLNHPRTRQAVSSLLAGRTLEQLTRDAVAEAMTNCGGNQTAAAKQLGISRTTLWRYLNQEKGSAPM